MTLLLGLVLGLPLGALGSLTGVGGGFLLMPVLLWLYPHQPAGALAVISLTVVFFNSLSGTILSARQDRVRFTTGLVYGLVSLPLVWLGTQGQALVDRETFTFAFGLFLVAGAAFLVFHRPANGPRKTPRRRIWFAGLAISLVVGVVSGFFGVGGGFLFVPLLAFFLRFPLPEATATSQLMVGLGSAFALATSALSYPLVIDPQLLGGLVAGVLVGSPGGTWASTRWSSRLILGILAALLVVVGIRFLWA